MPPSREREHSLLGEHCSAVRLSGGIDVVCLEGLDQRSMAGQRLRLAERPDFAMIDRLASAR